MKETKMLTKELFKKLAKEDKWISAMADPTSCYDSNHMFTHYKTCSYPIEYIITEDLIEKAKDLFKIRHKEIIDSIGCGVLAFRAQGGDFKSELKGGIGNYRICCYFKNNIGQKFFIELCSKAGHDYKFYVSYSIDEDLRTKREKELHEAYEKREKEHGFYSIVDKQDYYNCKHIEHETFDIPFTFDNVVKFINELFGCSYKKGILIENIASYKDWCCFCKDKEE